MHSVIECRNGTLASGGEDQLVMLWQRGRVHQVFRGHTASVNCLVECSNGKKCFRVYFFLKIRQNLFPRVCGHY